MNGPTFQQCYNSCQSGGWPGKVPGWCEKAYAGSPGAIAECAKYGRSFSDSCASLPKVGGQASHCLPNGTCSNYPCVQCAAPSLPKVNCAELPKVNGQLSYCQDNGTCHGYPCVNCGSHFGPAGPYYQGCCQTCIDITGDEKHYCQGGNTPEPWSSYALPGNLCKIVCRDGEGRGPAVPTYSVLPSSIPGYATQPPTEMQCRALELQCAKGQQCDEYNAVCLGDKTACRKYVEAGNQAPLACGLRSWCSSQQEPNSSTYVCPAVRTETVKNQMSFVDNCSGELQGNPTYCCQYAVNHPSSSSQYCKECNYQPLVKPTGSCKP